MTRRVMSMNVRRTAVIAVVAALSAAIASTGSSAPNRARTCPNPEGRACLGQLQAGRYRTKLFYPTLTYTVPSGWFNFEDTPGNFLLVPPWEDLPGVNAGTSDYIGAYAGIAAAKTGCDTGAARDVEHTPNAIARWIAHNPGLDASSPRPISIGGLRGLVVDVQMRKGWTKTCPYSGGAPVVQLITGSRRSLLEHGVVPRPMKVRLYLLARPDGGTLGVEVDDIAGGRHLALYSSIVKRLRFTF